MLTIDAFDKFIYSSSNFLQKSTVKNILLQALPILSEYLYSGSDLNEL